MNNMAEAIIDRAGNVQVTPDISPHEMFLRVGALTRQLHDALAEMGGTVESAVAALPDARARLCYIERLTGQAAEKVLNAAESGKEAQARLEAAAQAAPPGELRDAALAAAAATNERFTEIILAQDFHDLTGQVLKRVVTVAQDLEQQLLKLLLDSKPDRARAAAPEEAGLQGPAINAEGNANVATNQAQVDDLLESLGF